MKSIVIHYLWFIKKFVFRNYLSTVRYPYKFLYEIKKGLPGDIFIFSIMDDWLSLKHILYCKNTCHRNYGGNFFIFVSDSHSIIVFFSLT